MPLKPVHLFLLLLAACTCGNAQTKNTTSNELLLQKGHTMDVYAFAFSNDDKYMLSAGIEGDVIMWDIKRGAEIKRFGGHRNYLYRLNFCKNDSFFIVSDAAGIVYKWNIPEGRLVQEFKTGAEGRFVQFSKDGMYITTNQKDTCRLFDTRNLQLVKDFPGFREIKLSKSKVLLSGEKEVHILERNNLNKPTITPVNNQYPTTYDLSPDEQYLIISDIYNLKYKNLRDSTKSFVTIDAPSRYFLPAVGHWMITENSRRGGGDRKMVSIYNLEEGEKHTFNPNTSLLPYMDISPSGKYLATAPNLGHMFEPIKVWDVKTGRLMFEFRANVAEIGSFIQDPDNRFIYSARHYSTLLKWDLYSGEGIVWNSEQQIDGIVNSMALNKKKDVIALAVGLSLKLYSTSDGSLIDEITDNEYRTGRDVTKIMFWPDDQHLLTAHENGALKLWPLKTKQKKDGEEDEEYEDYDEQQEMAIGYCEMEINNIIPVSAKELIVSGSSTRYEKTIVRATLDQSKKEFDITPEDSYENVYAMSPYQKGTISAVRDEYGHPYLRVRDANFKEKGKIKGFEGKVGTFSVTGNTLVAGDDSGYVYIVNLESMKITQKKKYSVYPIETTELLWDKKVLAVNTVVDRNIILLEFPSLNPILSMYDSWKGWFLYNPNGYYFGSKNIDDLVKFSDKKHIYSFDQFDTWYNRPDLVLGALPNISPSVISTYQKAYSKRMRRMGLKENMENLASQQLAAPDIEVNIYDSLSNQKFIRLRIIARDTTHPLKNLIVFVNGVPEQGNRNRLNTGMTLDTIITIELSPGNNKIDITVNNMLGIESYKERVVVARPNENPDKALYILSFGSSTFKQSKYNLRYASKDATEFSAHFQKDSRYKNIHIKTLTNEACTRDGWVKAMQSIIDSAKVDDNVLLFFGTHGTVYQNTYYLATHDMDFLNPGATAIDFELVDSLLYAVRSRNKAVLIDACQSGEVDKEVISSVQKTIKMPGIVLRSATPALSASKQELQAFAVMKEQFAELEKRSGATILAASSGVEAAMESDEWKNGLFTYALLKGLKENEADLNADSRVSISELKKYIERTVSSLSNGIQRASTRNENILSDFAL